MEGQDDRHLRAKYRQKSQIKITAVKVVAMYNVWPGWSQAQELASPGEMEVFVSRAAGCCTKGPGQQSLQPEAGIARSQRDYARVWSALPPHGHPTVMARMTVLTGQRTGNDFGASAAVGCIDEEYSKRAISH